MYHVRALVFFVYGWISKGVCQMAPFGIENLLFGGLGAYPPSQPMGIPFGLGGLFGQGQFAPSIAGMPPSIGSFPGGPLPFPLFPMPCEITCDHGGLFFANINIGQPQRPGMPSGPSGPSGGGMPTGGGAGGMPGRPGGAPPGAPGGGMPGAPGGMPGARPPTGALPGGGMPTTPRPGAGGTQPTRPAPTTMPTRPPGPGMPQPQQPNINAQILYYVPNWAPYPSMSWPPYPMPFYG